MTQPHEVTEGSPGGSPYVLDNDRPTAHPMHEHLAAIMDRFTQQRLRRARILPGGRCLEIGAGNGSIARYLAEAVGPNGLVVATDIKPQHIAAHPRVQAVKHDITSDEPLPHTHYDLIHARLVLAHLPGRRQLVAKLADLLTPEGALVIEEWGCWSGPLLTADDPGAVDLYAKYQQCLLEVFASVGNDPMWAFNVADAMAEVGLTQVDVMVEAVSWPGESPGCRLPYVVSTELREPLIAQGMTPAELARLHRILADPYTLIMGNPTVSTIGRNSIRTTPK